MKGSTQLAKRGSLWRLAVLLPLLFCLPAGVCSGKEKAFDIADNQVPAFRGSMPAAASEAISAGTPYLTAESGNKIPPRKKATSKRSQKNVETKAPAAPAGPRPATLLLQSAGRNTSAPQPEPGFILNVPDSVGDGEAFLVEFGAEKAQGLRIEWRGKALNIGPCHGPQGICRALLPVPLDEKAKHLPLSMIVTWADGKKEKFSASLPVSLRNYPVQKLKVASKFVSPPASMQEKIKRDRAEFNAAIRTATPTRYWNPPFQRPVPGEVTSLFGLRRVFNDVPKSPHKGVDFDGKTGDPVRAIEDGVVILVSEHYYSGNIVMVDHGLGVISSYIHLSRFAVDKGQMVKRGETIGYIGSTGRVTGPHLHLSLHVLGVGVNAAACIDMRPHAKH